MAAHVLDHARRGTLRGWSGGATFKDAAAEWLRYVEQERDASRARSGTTGTSPAIWTGLRRGPLERIATDTIESGFRARVGVANRTCRRLVVLLNGIFKRATKVWGLTA